MYTIYCSEKAPDNFYRSLKDTDEYFPLLSLTELSKVNIFIGGNNSGKSRFLREMFINASSKSFFHIGDNYNQWAATNESVSLKETFNEYYEGNKRRNTDYRKRILELLDTEYVLLNEKSNLHSKIDKLSRYTYSLLNEIKRDKPISIFNGEKMYIPLLRGLQSLLNSNEHNSKFKYEDMYKERTCTQYFPNTLKKEVFTGQTVYQDLQDMLLGDLIDRQAVRDYETFLSKNIFDGKDIVLIPKNKKDTITVKIGNETEREIHNLGDGIQSLILLTFPIFMNKNRKMIFFIEEPEINMHPGMQRLFLKAILKNDFEHHQYFFTTHSNHFVDLALDYSRISIFMFKKVRYSENKPEHFEIERVGAGSVQILEQLGINNSSIYLSNCTIWVEGITDIYIMREYIKRELEQRNQAGNYVENLHYSFVEYGGSNISHLTIKDNSESNLINVKRISNKPIFIADFDREGKHKQRVQELGDDYYYIKGVKELENTLSEEILKRVIADYERIKVENLDLQDWDDFKHSKYKNKHLGEFINGQLKNKKRRGSYTKGNTISDKTNFLIKARRFLADESIAYEDAMSSSAIILANKLVDFIVESNRDILNV